jgi:hypothetical protein
MTRIDRRAFLIAAAGAAGAAWGGGTARATGSSGTRAAAVSSSRAAVYRDIVRALRAAPDGRFRYADPGAGARRFAHWYARQPAPVRRHADAVLDAVRAEGTPGNVALAAAPEGGRAAAAGRCAAIAAAIQLALVGCGPPPAVDERPEDLPPAVAA